ncbi:YlzJ-like family protein [Shimazuella kribbensis]|uniref:YlzJ-like family protein n=1 Tax=Shimazuella kribbensis TaxID=139808 RepID=UPI00048CA4A8|nr:YlzJ-like family protein [Shimazuella kribbensis]
MIHWTPLPEELIFSQQDDSLPAIHETIVDGVSLLVQQDGDAFRVVRLLSTDPAHFLDPRFQPGNVIMSSK